MPDMSRTLGLTNTATIVLFSSSLTAVHAQYAYGAIASCADFDCNTGISNCTVQDRSYNVAGSVPFESPFDNGVDLAWSVGANLSYPNGPLDPTLVKDYYLGTPPDLDMSGYHGCSVFFVDSNASFPVDQEPGTCSTVIGDDCVRALRDRATDIRDFFEQGQDVTAEDLCSALEDAFDDDDVPAECSAMALGDEFGRIRVRAITGPNAPMPPTEEQNATTNCNPVQPASYELAFALNFDADSSDPLWDRSLHGTASGQRPEDETIIDFVEHQAVPILNVFVPTNFENADEGLDAVVSSVSCLAAPVEAKNLDQAAVDEEGERDPDDNGAGGRIVTTAMLLVVAGLVMSSVVASA